MHKNWTVIMWPLCQSTFLVSSIAKHSAVVRRLQYKLKGPFRIQRLILDAALGVFIWKALIDVEFFADYIWEGLGMMIVRLEQLIHWLTTYPAGLKLNAHLNAILSQFFVYHIYLWQTYLSVASVYVGFGFVSLSCFLGISVFFAALSDLLRLLTIHIYCFHIYASKLTLLWVTSIQSLWRVFRGKKYNPLRDRVDSVKLDTRQLFIATLFFIILLFLLPTILVYFFVFSPIALLVSQNEPSKHLILDARPEEEFAKEHIIGAKHYPRLLLCRERYETEPMKAAGPDVTVLVCGEVYGAGQVVSTFRDRGYNAILVRGDVESWKRKYPEGLLTSTDNKKTLDFEKLSVQLAVNRRPAFERSNFLKATISSKSRNTVRKDAGQNQKNKRRAWR